jgi:UPF0042 nucleotide-binding protein
LYLDASEELLARRFSATRRPHPLTRQPSYEVHDVLEGMRLEKELLIPLRALASLVLDTSDLSVNELRRAVRKSFGVRETKSNSMHVRVLSFGFKFGAPSDADMVLDVRFLPNPYFVEELRPCSGKDRAVSEYVLSNPDAVGFLEHAISLLSYCLPRFVAEGKSYLTIALGCTGGRHRSVALTERISLELSKSLGIDVSAAHRDIGRAEHLAPPVSAVPNPPAQEKESPR